MCSKFSINTMQCRKLPLVEYTSIYYYNMIYRISSLVRKIDKQNEYTFLFSFSGTTPRTKDRSLNNNIKLTCLNFCDK